MRLIKRQFNGVLYLTVGLLILAVVARIFGDTALTEADGRHRRGVFVLWVLLILIFTVINLFAVVFSRLKQSKRF